MAIKKIAGLQIKNTSDIINSGHETK